MIDVKLHPHQGLARFIREVAYDNGISPSDVFHEWQAEIMKALDTLPSSRKVAILSALDRMTEDEVGTFASGETDDQWAICAKYGIFEYESQMLSEAMGF